LGYRREKSGRKVPGHEREGQAVEGLHLRRDEAAPLLKKKKKYSSHRQKRRVAPRGERTVGPVGLLSTMIISAIYTEEKERVL